MTLREKIQQSLISALKEKNEMRVLTLRGIISAINNKEIELKGAGKELAESDVLDTLKKELKKRNDAAQMFLDGNRAELAGKEKEESVIIQEFLPQMLSEDETQKLIAEVLGGYQNPTLKDMGGIVKAVMEKAKGAADGGMVARLVKEKLL
jgi:hypothetical protein